jgi:acyl-CoA oxidase
MGNVVPVRTASHPTTARERQSVLDGRWAHVRAEARRVLAGARWAPVHGEDAETARTPVAGLARGLAALGQTGLGLDARHGGSGDLGGSVASIEELASADLSPMVKAGVQRGLFGGAPRDGARRAHLHRPGRRVPPA